MKKFKIIVALCEDMIPISFIWQRSMCLARDVDSLNEELYYAAAKFTIIEEANKYIEDHNLIGYEPLEVNPMD